MTFEVGQAVAFDVFYKIMNTVKCVFAPCRSYKRGKLLLPVKFTEVTMSYLKGPER